VTTKSESRCRIDSVEAGELSVIALGLPAPQLAVKYALSNSESGNRFGAGHVNGGWSDRTMELTRELLASVEADLLSMVFEGDGTTTSSGIVSELARPDELPSF
jgi:hypothetical protein